MLGTTDLWICLYSVLHLTSLTIGWLVGVLSTNTAVSETKGQGWTVILLPSERRLAIY